MSHFVFSGFNSVSDTVCTYEVSVNDEYTEFDLFHYSEQKVSVLCYLAVTKKPG